jgi:protein phosphatase
LNSTRQLQWSGCTDRGKVRSNNEDSFLGLQFNGKEIHRLGKFGETTLGDADCVFAVSDGMGGARAGEFASRIAVEKITTLLPPAFRLNAEGLPAGYEDVLTELFAEIHNALAYLGHSYEECHGMETTLSLCWFTPQWMYFAHIGDSRIYFLPAQTGKLKRLSEDDTHVDWLYRNGQLNEREARTHPRRTVLQKSLGAGNQFVNPQFGAVAPEPGDTILLCTDGVIDGLFDQQIAESLQTADADPARRLVNEALHNSGRDNTTALIIRVL